MLVLNTGSKSISVVDIASAKEVSHTAVPDAWLGLAMTRRSGDKVYVGGGARAAVFEFSFANGALTAGRTFPIAAAKRPFAVRRISLKRGCKAGSRRTSALRLEFVSRHGGGDESAIGADPVAD